MAKKKTTTEVIEEDVNDPQPLVDPDAALLTGHPANGGDLDPAPSPDSDLTPDSDTLEKIVVDGQEYMVAPDIARSYRSERAASADALAALPATRTPDPGGYTVPQEEELDTAAFFTDPEGFLKRRDAKLKEEVLQEVTEAYNQDQRRGAFWDNFYGAHEELKADKEIVHMTLSANWDSLQGLPGSEAIDKLAEATKKTILAITNRHGRSGKKSRNVTAELEGASPPSSKAAEESDEDRLPISLSAALKQRAKNRRQHANLTT